MPSLKNPQPEKGDSVEELWKVVAEMYDVGNALSNMTLSPPGAGKFVYSDSNVVLQLNKQLGIPTPPATGTYVLGSIESVVQWIATELCECGSIDGGSASA